MKKRVLSLLLCLCVAAVMLPTAVFAADAEEELPGTATLEFDNADRFVASDSHVAVVLRIKDIKAADGTPLEGITAVPTYGDPTTITITPTGETTGKVETHNTSVVKEADGTLTITLGGTFASKVGTYRMDMTFPVEVGSTRYKITTNSVSITVVPAFAVYLVPSEVTIKSNEKGTLVLDDFTVAVTDQPGNIRTNDSGYTMTAKIKSPTDSCQIIGGDTAVVNAGVATFSGLTIQSLSGNVIPAVTLDFSCYPQNNARVSASKYPIINNLSAAEITAVKPVLYIATSDRYVVNTLEVGTTFEGESSGYVTLATNTEDGVRFSNGAKTASNWTIDVGETGVTPTGRIDVREDDTLRVYFTGTVSAGDITFAAKQAAFLNAAEDSDPFTVTLEAESDHTHAWAADWDGSDTHHWHNCTASDCTVIADSGKNGYGEHDYTDDADATCNTCGYVRTVSGEEPVGPVVGTGLTRLDAAKLLVRYGQPQAGNIENMLRDYGDCANLTDEEKAVVAAVRDAEWMLGDDRGFGPEKPINRVEAAVVVAKMLNVDYSYYEDACPFGDVYDWAKGWVGAIAANGVVDLKDYNTADEFELSFDPGRTITKAELVEWLTNAGYTSVGITSIVKSTEDTNNGVTVSYSNGIVRLSGVLDYTATSAARVILLQITATDGAQAAVSFIIYRDDDGIYLSDLNPIIRFGNVVKIDVTGLSATLDGKPIGGSTGGNTSSGGNTSGGSGSSGSSGSSGNTSTSSVKNPDGSTTTKTENKTTGTVTETTTNTDGSKTVVETKKDGTVTTTETDKAGNKSEVVERPDGSKTTTIKNANGAQATTEVSASGRTEVKATISSAAVISAQGAAVTIPMPEITVARNNSSAAAITVTTNSAAPVKVEVPVRNATVTTVAVLVTGDGAEEIIKASLVTGNGISAPVPNGATIKIVDNAKSFTDTSTHWANDAIRFVSAREIFSGVGNGSFAPEGVMTRAMMVTALAQFDGADVTGGEKWYDRSMEWARANGVSDGSNPDGTVTREQLASMLWRYAGQPAPKTSQLNFKDGAQASEYAIQALCWAVENGIMSGYDGNLDPAGPATRAQVASMFTRFVGR